MSSDPRTTETDCLADWCADETWCGLTCALDVLDRKWSPVVVAVLLEEPRGFAAIHEAISEVSETVLSETLDDLTAADVVERRTVSERPHRVEYRLTEAGRDLEPVVEALQEWGERHAGG
jgi:DNA-binding HxlR family transcriptional regulator